MAEIYRNTSQKIFLDLVDEEADATPELVAYLNGSDDGVNIDVIEVTPPEGITQRYSAVISMALTTNDCTLVIKWSFKINGVDVIKTDNFDIVTPYLPLDEIKKIMPAGSSDDDIHNVESAVRHIINANTGQTFGRYEGSITVEAHGEDALALPRRLIKITGLSTLTAELDPNATIIVSDGWFLKKGWAHELSNIDSDSAYWGGWDISNALPGEPGYEKPAHGPIIVAPGHAGTPTRWRNDYPFKITGIWGYDAIPYPVQEAARLLVNDYGCMNAIYRDRYLQSIRSADWRLQFSSRAWDSTGNVRADQLLSEYVIAEWAVV